MGDILTKVTLFRLNSNSNARHMKEFDQLVEVTEGKEINISKKHLARESLSQDFTLLRNRKTGLKRCKPKKQ